MVCASCGKRSNNVPSAKPVIVAQTNDTLPLVGKSDGKDLVKLRYMGGGYRAKASATGCKSCGGGGQYHFVTSETISFVSEDAPNDYFSQLFSVGHDYYVTEKQAEYLLTLTYISKAGRTVNKFKKSE